MNVLKLPMSKILSEDHSPKSKKMKGNRDFSAALASQMFSPRSIDGFESTL